jgi:hypothetical protein
MRKLLTWVVVTLGIAALIRKLRRRGTEPEPVPGLSPQPEPASAEPADQPESPQPGSAQPGSAEPDGLDPADELRQKLAESRSEEATPPTPAPGSVEERRAEVHEQGRAALDEMQPPEES